MNRPSRCISRPCSPRIWRAIFLVGSLLVVAVPAGADFLRCGGDLVAVGDRKFDLLQRCGEPALKESRTKERSVKVWDRDRRVLRGVTVSVLVEEWTYNFGPHRFYYVVRMEDGRIIAIESGGRGY